MYVRCLARLSSSFSILALLAVPSVAQRRFDELPRQHLPRVHEESYSVAVGDLNGDGLLDAVVGNYNAPDEVWLGDGRGVFRDATAALLETGYATTMIVRLADVDGDHDLDLLTLGGVSGHIRRLYLNDGRGRLREAPGRVPTSRNTEHRDAEFVDLDGDGDLDLAIARRFNEILVNDGTGTFRHAAAHPIEQFGSRSVVAGDFDGNGHVDLVFDRVLVRNDGEGHLTILEGAFPTFRGTSTSMTAGDIDGDGDLDLFFGEYSGDLLYLNDGTARFTPAAQPALRSSGSFGPVFFDMERDGDLDLYAGGVLLANDGSGSFVDVTATQLLERGSTWARSAVAADVDRDGDADLVVAAGDNKLYVNDGDGVFANGMATAMPRSFGRAAELGDVDGDGDLDLVASEDRSQTVPVLLNDGAGNLARLASGFLKLRAPDIALGDVDGDGDLDAYVATAQFGGVFGIPLTSPQDRLYLNDGAGTFTEVTATHLPVDPQSSGSVELGDVDGDGDLDAVVSKNSVVILENDGRGFFSQAPGAPLSGLGRVLLDDLDGDGDVDVVIGQAPPQGTVVHRNDGSGGFTEVTAAAFPAGAAGELVLLVDVDRDGDSDGVLTGYSRLTPARLIEFVPPELVLNDGSGRFTVTAPGRIPSEREFMWAWAAGDFDRDGDLDLAAAGDLRGSASSFGRRLFLNDGMGTFVTGTPAIESALGGTVYDLVVGDMDGDGDLDWIDVSGVYEGNVMQFNLDSQIHAPRLAGLGKPYPIDLYWQPGYARGEVLAIPLLADHGARIPLAGMGTLGLDPERLMVLPPIPIDPAVGQARLELAIPNVEALRERTLWVQALFLPGDAPPRLSNVLRDEIRF